MTPHDGSATWESRVRGLMLGLALGDAIGSKRSDVPPAGRLEAGAATQLAAWTTEGLLRTATRYGDGVIASRREVVLRAYQRWAMLRGGAPSTSDWDPVPVVDGAPARGWLLDVPAMARKRGSSPSTMKAVLSGRPTSSFGCQALLRTLPYAALAGPTPAQGEVILGVEKAGHYGAALAELTHRNRRTRGIVQFAVMASAVALRSTSVATAARVAMGSWCLDAVRADVQPAYEQGLSAPCVPQHLERLAPDKSVASAFAGGLYVALSFPEADSVADALEFAGWAPDGDSVAAVAGALLGAVHGYEALPVAMLSRLELGWVMDQLAIDLAAEVRRGPFGGPERGAAAPRGPWWEARYPGV